MSSNHHGSLRPGQGREDDGRPTKGEPDEGRAFSPPSSERGLRGVASGPGCHVSRSGLRVMPTQVVASRRLALRSLSLSLPLLIPGPFSFSLFRGRRMGSREPRESITDPPPDPISAHRSRPLPGLRACQSGSTASPDRRRAIRRQSRGTRPRSTSGVVNLPQGVNPFPPPTAPPASLPSPGEPPGGPPGQPPIKPRVPSQHTRTDTLRSPVRTSRLVGARARGVSRDTRVPGCPDHAAIGDQIS